MAHESSYGPKAVPVCSQLKLVQAETSSRDAESSCHNKSSHSPGLGVLWDAGNLWSPSFSLAVSQHGWRADTLCQCLNPGWLQLQLLHGMDPCTSLENHPCTSHYNPHPNCLQAPDVPASLAPCLAMARNSQRLLFNPKQVPGLETCWLQTFLPLLKDLGHFLPCKAVCFFLEGLKR